MIVDKKWVRFTLPLENAVIALVHEFYANPSVEVTIRGQKVAYDWAVTNAYFQVPVTTRTTLTMEFLPTT